MCTARSGILYQLKQGGPRNGLQSVTFLEDTMGESSQLHSPLMALESSRAPPTGQSGFGMLYQEPQLAGLCKGTLVVYGRLHFLPTAIALSRVPTTPQFEFGMSLSGTLVSEPLQGHADRVQSVGFSPDGARIISVSPDETLRIWDAVSGAPIDKPLQWGTLMECGQLHFLPTAPVLSQAPTTTQFGFGMCQVHGSASLCEGIPMYLVCCIFSRRHPHRLRLL